MAPDCMHTVTCQASTTLYSLRTCDISAERYVHMIYLERRQAKLIRHISKTTNERLSPLFFQN